MRFDYIPKTRSLAERNFGYVRDFDGFYRFIDEYNIVGLNPSAKAEMLSASYFLRLLMDGSSARAHVERGNWGKNDEYSQELYDFASLFDHGDFWQLKDGSVIFTSMPYTRSEEGTILSFESLVEALCKLKPSFTEPQALKLEFLDDQYRYRPNGDFFIMIYYDSGLEQFDPSMSEQEIRDRAIEHSSRRNFNRYNRRTVTYVRDKYVSEYAKIRARGICQLCGEPAPFLDKNGRPYLETHHIIWLADGGDNSIENTVALCPNCHRKMHILNLDEDVEKLLRIAQENV